jgi:hypothetical protein
VVGAVTRRPVPVSPAIVPGQQRVEGSDEILVGARTKLDHDHAGRRVGHPDVQEAVAPVGRVGDEPRAVGREVEEPPAGAGPDVEEGRPQGKMDRIASRTRPSAPSAGTDS